ncbi:MAG: hypothetical protein AB7P76_09135 [Candidatus Melainabacteria bacterium]
MTSIHPQLRYVLSLAAYLIFVLALGLLGRADAQTLPSLFAAPAATSGEMTPLSEISPEAAGEQPVAAEAAIPAATPAEEHMQPATLNAPPDTTVPMDMPVDVPATAPMSTPMSTPMSVTPPVSAPTPAPETAATPEPVAAPLPANARQTLKDRLVNKVTKGKITTYYTPLPAIAIFPVLKPGGQRAFSDIPVMFSREYALKMERMAKGTRVMNPVYTVDELRLRGIGHVYDQVMKYYNEAGRPEPTAMGYLLEQIAPPDHPIARVIFVEADVDFSEPMAFRGFSSLKGMARNLIDNSHPPHPTMAVRSRIQVFDTEDPQMPMIWSLSWMKPVKTESLNNVTSSVYLDSDSQRIFSSVSRQMSLEMSLVTPPSAYQEKHVETGVQGSLVSTSNK